MAIICEITKGNKHGGYLVLPQNGELFPRVTFDPEHATKFSSLTSANAAFDQTVQGAMTYANSTVEASERYDRAFYDYSITMTRK